jgi:hypothetical protein
MTDAPATNIAHIAMMTQRCARYVTLPQRSAMVSTVRHRQMDAGDVGQLQALKTPL